MLYLFPRSEMGEARFLIVAEQRQVLLEMRSLLFTQTRVLIHTSFSVHMPLYFFKDKSLLFAPACTLKQ